MAKAELNKGRTIAKQGKDKFNKGTRDQLVLALFASFLNRNSDWTIF